MEELKHQHIESFIITMSDLQILIDRNFAELHSAKTKILHQAAVLS